MDALKIVRESHCFPGAPAHTRAHNSTLIRASKRHVFVRDAFVFIVLPTHRVDDACECSNMVPQTTESREDNAKGGCVPSAEQEVQDLLIFVSYGKKCKNRESLSYKGTEQSNI